MDAAEVKEHVRVYVLVFAALAVLTVVTVGLSYIHLPTPSAIAVAMAVALVKAGLVAGFFMHLVSERRIIHWVLLLCFAFFVFLMLLPLGTQMGIEPLWPLSD
jgi:cytochrome c oxidase subunit 4